MYLSLYNHRRCLHPYRQSLRTVHHQSAQTGRNLPLRLPLPVFHSSPLSPFALLLFSLHLLKSSLVPLLHVMSLLSQPPSRFLSASLLCSPILLHRRAPLSLQLASLPPLAFPLLLPGFPDLKNLLLHCTQFRPLLRYPPLYPL